MVQSWRGFLQQVHTLRVYKVNFYYSGISYFGVFGKSEGIQLGLRKSAAPVMFAGSAAKGPFQVHYCPLQIPSHFLGRLFFFLFSSFFLEYCKSHKGLRSVFPLTREVCNSAINNTATNSNFSCRRKLKTNIVQVTSNRK